MSSYFPMTDFFQGNSMCIDCRQSTQLCPYRWEAASSRQCISKDINIQALFATIKSSKMKFKYNANTCIAEIHAIHIYIVDKSCVKSTHNSLWFMVIILLNDNYLYNAVMYGEFESSCACILTPIAVSATVASYYTYKTTTDRSLVYFDVRQRSLGKLQYTVIWPI